MPGLGLRRGVLGCLSAAGFGAGRVSGRGGRGFHDHRGAVVGWDGGRCWRVLLSSATIYWGDGTPTSVGVSDGGTGVRGSHTYADERTANGNVSYTCSNLVGTQTAYFTATVADAPLTAGGLNVSGTAGQSVSGVVAHSPTSTRRPVPVTFRLRSPGEMVPRRSGRSRSPRTAGLTSPERTRTTRPAATRSAPWSRTSAAAPPAQAQPPRSPRQAHRPGRRWRDSRSLRTRPAPMC